MAKIICPICDEELGNCIEDVPDKCPICDTRKHEILLELKSKESGRLSFTESTSIPKPAASTSPLTSPIVETETEQALIEEAADEVIFTDVPVRPASVLLGDDPPGLEDPLVVETQPSPTASVSEVMFPKRTNDSFAPEEIKQEPTTTTPPTTPPPSVETASAQLKMTIESASVAPQTVNKSGVPKILPTGEDEDTSESPESSSVAFLPQKRAVSQGPAKSGASSLEMLPGYRLCSKCGTAFAKDYNQPCSCGNTTLTIVEKGFAPGHYLVLYNSQRKAIAYFRLVKEGSIFIGRSSERGSDRDIDLSIAWKHFYYRHATAEEDFKEQMRLLKGISRKHALIRYDKELQKFVLFHLSDKNYTVAEMPNGEKRPRAPNNRNRIELQSDTIISMGNQKDYIILRYKEIAATAPS